MGTWNRRKKYSIEGNASDEKRPKIKLQLNKLVKRELYLTMLSIVAVTMVIIGSTYAIFSSVNKSKDYNVINVGTLEISYEDTGSGLGDIIKLNNAFPISDSDGMNTTGYKFKITNTGSLDSNYSVRIADDQAMIDADGCVDNLLPKTVLKYSLNSGSPTLLSSKANYVIDSGIIKAGATKTYDLKMWIKSDAGNEILGKHFHGKIVIESEVTEMGPTPESCFDFDEGTNRIKSYSNTCPKDVVIPKTINGVDVRVIFDSAFQSKQLTSVVIPSSVTSIGRNAFSNNQLTSVVIPSGVTSIGETAFFTNQLTNVIIPSSVTNIASMAFNDNQLPDNLAFIYKRNANGTEDKTTIVSYGGSKRNNVQIPEGVKSIEMLTFNLNQLTSVVIPNTVTSIGSSAFMNNQLTSVVIPSNVTSIGSYAFGNNPLTSVIIKGKSSSANFTSYPSSSPFSWASGYSDANITWNG